MSAFSYDCHVGFLLMRREDKERKIYLSLAKR
jgi:hypothetical protein